MYNNDKVSIEEFRMLILILHYLIWEQNKHAKWSNIIDILNTEFLYCKGFICNRTLEKQERTQESKKTKKCNIAVIYYMNIQTEKPIEEYK